MDPDPDPTLYKLVSFKEKNSFFYIFDLCFNEAYDENEIGSAFN